MAKQIKKTTKNNNVVLRTVKIDTRHNELLNIMLKKAGLKIDDIFEASYKKWAINNVDDLLTKEDKEKYKDILA